MRRWGLALAALLAAGLLIGWVGEGQPVGALRVADAWSRATPPGAGVAVGFMRVINAGKRDDRLLEVSSDAAERVEIHEVSHDGGVMRMRQLRDGLPLPAGATVRLQPGGYHLMFIAPKRPFKQGDTVSARLRFEHAGSATVRFQVRALGAKTHDGP
ncbi:copper chaperone PCu(A)C [Lysobacter sp. Root983]|uniref:copper chaperone PCu(A)C n=1 Tax=Lysobacter sp. Root983 TaxID=1736613 RepID=UPI00070F9D0E|nr:copper chaperone PCu(A)C [Lysobacter sp. Root983]KRD76976.1 hypothetical protein ASE43_07265 [Lysobacter sp. Root983]